MEKVVVVVVVVAGVEMVVMRVVMVPDSGGRWLRCCREA